MLNSVPDPLITARRDQETITFQNSPWQTRGKKPPLWHMCAKGTHTRAAPQPHTSHPFTFPFSRWSPRCPNPAFPIWGGLDLQDPPAGLHPSAWGPQNLEHPLAPPRMSATCRPPSQCLGSPEPGAPSGCPQDVCPVTSTTHLIESQMDS